MKQVRVLLVDDHELVRRGLKEVLRDTRFEVCGEAENGEQGVEQALKLKPGLVLLDMSMPVMTGLQAAKKIRKLAPETKIIIVTIHNSPQMQAEAVAAGADGYVTKMSAATTLVSAMEALFETPIPQLLTDRLPARST
jgi:DNA-binding NarL/FixJ family response regulator